MNIIENNNKFLLLNRSNRFNFDSTNFKLFLAGFIEGEGNLNISIKKQEGSRFGYVIDPEFSLYRHMSGLPFLKNVQSLFRSGQIKKIDLDNVVYTVYNRKIIYQKIIPYFLKYVIPFSCKFVFIDKFISIIKKLENKEHHRIKGFFAILELVYQFNPNLEERKQDLDILKNKILRDYTPNKDKL